MRKVLFVFLMFVLAGCSGDIRVARKAPTPLSPPFAGNALYVPYRAVPGRLEYVPGPDAWSRRDTFAPILTQRSAYPTQYQANEAYRRARFGAAGFYSGALVTKGAVSKDADSGTTSMAAGSTPSIRLFACQPGRLDSQTGRVTRYKGPIVLCATDVLGRSGEILYRETVNFYYRDKAWHADVANPPLKPVLR